MTRLPDLAWRYGREQALAEADIPLGGPGRCAWSGLWCEETWPFRPSDSFSDWGDLGAPESTRAHPGYAWMASHHQESHGRSLGLRRYSLLASPRGLERAGKDEKSRIRGWLLDPPEPPWALLVADQGQRHYAWRTPANLERDEYLVQMDEHPIKLVRRRWADLLHAVERCYRAGVPKAELERAEPTVVHLGRLREDPDDWEAWCAVEAAYHSGEVGALAVAVWCAQREEDGESD